MVVTIIVLIILATISINAVFGDNGLIKKAEQSKETHIEAQAKEKLSLKLAEYKVEIYEQGIKDTSLRDSYLCTKLSELGPTKEATDTNYYEVIVDGYVFWVKKDTQEIVSKGKDNTADATKVTASNITVKEGQTASIAVTIEPAGASTRNVTYKSSDESIATVSNGTVTGVGAGTATITIKTKNGHEETFEVTVIESNLTKITLNPTTLSFIIGETASQKINATLEPADAMNRKIVWASTDTNVATVNDSGEVTAVGKGTCTITATSEKSASVYGSCSVTVSEIEVDSISLDKTTLKVGIGKTSEALVVTFTPANATNKTITWTSDTTSVATVDENTGVITGVAEGTATITATTANGKTATCSVTVGEVGMTIAEAKAAIQRDGLQAHIGDLVEYTPKAGGKWRIFYYDADGSDFGTTGKLYLKRDYVSNDTTLSSYIGYTPSAQGLAIMKAMNPQWRDRDYSDIDQVNEHCVAWLCDPDVWNEKYKTAEADYAIGSPSVEMYMKAYNVWKDNNKDSTTLICEIGSQYGYSVGAQGSYTWNGSNEYNTGMNSIESGPNNIFMTAGYNHWWLASPSSYNDNYVLYVDCNHMNVNYDNYSYAYGVCPVVSL